MIRNAVQQGENVRNSLGSNYKSAAPPLPRFALWFARQAFRTNSDTRTALFCAIRAKRSFSQSAVNTLMNASLRCNRAD
jgi:hypothetical protein